MHEAQARATAVLGGLVQPDARSCGACCVVVAAALQDPAYASLLREPGRWRAEVLRTHREITSFRDRGRVGLLWPRSIGTPPWSVSRRLTTVTGRGWRTRWCVSSRASASIRVAVAASAPDGASVPIFVGSRLLPRHVLLAVGLDGAGEILAYDPGRGQVLPLDVLLQTGWPRVWAVVLPR